MKKRYQIRKQRAVERFQSWAASRSEPIQLSFPTGAGAELLQQSLGDLLRRDKRSLGAKSRRRQDEGYMDKGDLGGPYLGLSVPSLRFGNGGTRAALKHVLRSAGGES